MPKKTTHPAERNIRFSARICGVLSALLMLPIAWAFGIWETIDFFSPFTLVAVIVTYVLTWGVMIMGESTIEDVVKVLISGILFVVGWKVFGGKIPVLRIFFLSMFVGVCFGAVFNFLIAPARRKWEQDSAP